MAPLPCVWSVLDRPAARHSESTFWMHIAPGGGVWERASREPDKSSGIPPPLEVALAP